MRVMRILLPLCLTAVACGANAQPSGDLGWSTLENRSGASVDFPGGLFTNEVSADAGKMLAFTTADGRSRFELFTIPNSRRESPAQFARRADSRRERLDYKRITHNFIALHDPAGSGPLSPLQFQSGNDPLHRPAISGGRGAGVG